MLMLPSVHICLFGYNYKTIGLANGIDDNLLSWAGSIAAITQAVTRISVGSLYDKIGFKPLFYMLAIANLVAGLTCYLARHNKWTFFFVI